MGMETLSGAMRRRENSCDAPREKEQPLIMTHKMQMKETLENNKETLRIMARGGKKLLETIKKLLE